MRWLPGARKAQLKEGTDATSLNKNTEGMLTGLLIKGKMLNGHDFSI